MLDLLEATLEVARMVGGALVLGVFLWLVWKFLRLGPDLVAARAMLQQSKTWRVVFLLILSLLAQLASTGVELYGSVSGGLAGSSMYVHSFVEVLTLAFLLVGLLLFVPIVRVPVGALRLKGS